MGETLRERIEKGELAELLDPALPLEQLADPNPRRWSAAWAGAARELAAQLAQRLPLIEALVVLDAWWEPNLPPRPRADAEAWARARETEAQWTGVVHFFRRQADEATRIGMGDQPRFLRLLDLAERLRAALAEAPAPLDEALAVLRRMVGAA